MLLQYFIFFIFFTSFSNAYESIPSWSNAPTLDEFLTQNPELHHFFHIIRFDPYFNNTLNWKSGTLLVPNNTALEEYLKFHDGKIDHNTLKYHYSNLPRTSREMDELISSDMPGNPPIWVTTNADAELFLNDARIVKRDLRVRIGVDQIVHSLDKVLIPTVPNTSGPGGDLNNPTARKFLSAASSYNTTRGFQISDFVSRVHTLKRETSYHNVGKHTFFIPINNAFQKTSIYKVDNKVIDGHIIPGVVLFLPSAPLNREIQALTYESADPAFAYQNFPIFISFEKSNRTDQQGRSLRTDIETWNVVSNNRIDDQISGSRYRRGKVQAEIVRGNIPVRNGVIHLIKQPLVLIESTIYHVLEAQGYEDGGEMYEFFRIINDYGRHTGIYELLLRTDINRKLTLFVPTNEAIVRSRSFLNTVTNKEALTEILKFHILEQEFTTDYIYNMSLQTNAPIEASTTRGPDWRLHFTIGRDSNTRAVRVEGGGTTAILTKTDIGAINGVIHMIDRVLGIEDQTMYEKLRTEHMLESTFRISSQNYYNRKFQDERQRFTFFAPSNAAWDKFTQRHPLESSKLFQGGYSSGNLLDKHIIIGQELNIEELANISSSYGRESGSRYSISTYSSSIRVASVQDPDWLKIKQAYGEGSTSYYPESGSSSSYYGPRLPSSGRVYGDYKYVIFWNGQESYVVRPNIKTTNGIVHIIDYPFIVPGDVIAGSWRIGGISLHFWLFISTMLLTLI